MVSEAVPTRLHGQVKKSSSVSKEKVVYVRLHFTQTESHKADVTVSTAPVIETSDNKQRAK